MAESWTDVIRDTQRYPDTMTLDLGDGRGQVPLGDLRATIARNLHEVRQRGDILSEEKRVLEERLAFALANPTTTDPTPANTAARPPIDYESDPILRPLHQSALEAQRLAADNAKRLDEMTKLQQQLMAGIAQIPAIMRLEQLKQADPSLDPRALQEYTQRVLQQPDLAVFHRAMTYDQAVARAKEAGIAEGKAQAEKERAAIPTVPYAPYGPPQGMTIPTPDFQTLDEAENAVLSDPEMLSLFYPGA